MPKDGDVRDEAVDTTAGTAQDADHQEHDHEGLRPQAEQGGIARDDEGASGFDEPAGLEELERELADLREQLLRKSADFENYRRRMQRDKEEFASYANRELLLDLLPVIDDFERAIRSGEESRDFDAFHDGIVMIEKQFVSMLDRKWKLQRFDSVGEEFDPQRHEAMMTEEVPGHDRSMVLEDFQKGYVLRDRVLRPAKVKVSMPAPGREAGQENTRSSASAADDPESTDT